MALDITNGDLTMTNGKFDQVTGLALVGLRVKDRLFTFRNEWFLDLEFGVPYLESILGQKPSNLSGIAAILKAEIRKSLKGEASLTAFQIVLDSATRELKGSYIIVGAGEVQLSEQFII